MSNHVHYYVFSLLESITHIATKNRILTKCYLTRIECVLYVKWEAKSNNLKHHKMENINTETEFLNYFKTSLLSAKYSNTGISTRFQYLLFKQLMCFCKFSGESPAARKDNVMLQITGRNCERATLRNKLQDECRRSKWKCMERSVEQIW